MGVLSVCACLSALKPLAVGGLAIAPKPPIGATTSKACRCIKSRGSPKPVAGNVVATSFNLTPLEGWVNLGELVKDTRQ